MNLALLSSPQDMIDVARLMSIVNTKLAFRIKAGFHLNFGPKMNFCFFSKLAILTI